MCTASWPRGRRATGAEGGVLLYRKSCKVRALALGSAYNTGGIAVVFIPASTKANTSGTGGGGWHVFAGEKMAGKRADPHSPVCRLSCERGRARPGARGNTEAQRLGRSPHGCILPSSWSRLEVRLTQSGPISSGSPPLLYVAGIMLHLERVASVWGWFAGEKWRGSAPQVSVKQV